MGFLRKLFRKLIAKIQKQIQEDIEEEMKAPDGPAILEPEKKPEDEVPFEELKWTYGRVNGSSRKNIVATIAGLKVSENKMAYHWADPGCEDMGAEHKHDAGHTLACMFFKNEKGEWLGGKFDWISTDRLTRSFENIYGSYRGWDGESFKKASEYAFVIIQYRGNKRTNVIKFPNR